MGRNSLRLLLGTALLGLMVPALMAETTDSASAKPEGDAKAGAKPGGLVALSLKLPIPPDLSMCKRLLVEFFNFTIIFCSIICKQIYA